MISSFHGKNALARGESQAASFGPAADNHTVSAGTVKAQTRISSELRLDVRKAPAGPGERARR